MNQPNESTSSVPPAELPAKRKRGRPRKDDRLAQEKSSTVLPRSDNTRNSQHIEVASSDKSDDSMVGQLVSGVVEDSFDAGYFLTVRVGDTDTLLTGVVFQPGRFTPISEANDVAPNARMYKRRNVPIPVGDTQAPFNGTTPSPKQNNERPAHLENQAPVVPVLAPSKFPPGTSFALHKQPASTSVCSTSNLPKNDSGVSFERTVIPEKNVNPELLSSEVLVSKFPSDPSFALFAKQSANASVTVADNLPKNESGFLLGRTVMPQKNVGFGIEFQHASQLDSNKTVEQCKVMQDLKGSHSKDGPNMSIQTSKDFNLDLASPPIVEECKMMRDIEASPLLEESKVDMVASKDLNLDLASKPDIEQYKVIPNLGVSPLAEGLEVIIDMVASKDTNVDLTSKPVIEESKAVLGASKDLNLELTSKPVFKEHNVMEFDGLPLSERPNIVMEAVKGLNLDLAPNPVVESCELMHEFEVSHSVKRPKVFLEESEDLNLDAASNPICNIRSGDDDTVSPEAQVQLQPDGYVIRTSELVEAELKIPNLELQLTSVVSEPKSVSPVRVDIMMEKQDPPERVFPAKDFMQLERPDNIPIIIETPENFNPVSDAAVVDEDETDTQSAPKTALIIQEEVETALEDAISPTQNHGHPFVSNNQARNGNCIQN